MVENSVEFDHPLVLVVADKIERIEDITRILEIAKKAKKSLVVFS